MGWYYLTDEAAGLLQRLLYRIKRVGPTNRRKQSSPALGQNQGQLLPSSNVYLAKPVDADGIPALTPAEGSTPDIPGEGECYIYHLTVNDDGDYNTQIISDLTRIVYNLSEYATGSGYLVVARTKFGKWVAVTGAAGASSIDCECGDCLDEGSYPSCAYLDCEGPESYSLDTSGIPCCTGATSPAILSRVSNCVYQSEEFECESVVTGSPFTTQWVLGIHDSTLVYLSIDLGGDRDLAYYAYVEEWAPLCRNKMRLSLNEGPPLCGGLPCEICITPVAAGTGS